MRKFIVVLSLLALMAGSAVALPSYSGLRGLNRTVDARTGETGFLSIGLFTFLGVSPDERTAQLSAGETVVTDVEYSGTGYFNLGYAVNNNFELGANVSYLMNQLAREDVDGRLGTTGDWNGDDGFSEAGLAAKFTFNPDAENLWFGLAPWVHLSVYDGGDNNFVYNGDEWDGIWETDEPMFELRRPMMSAGDMSFGGDILASMDLDAVTLHLNAGYHYYKQHFVFTDRRFDTSHNVIATEEVDIEVVDPVLHVAAGIEYPLNKTTLFAEVEWRKFLDREFEEGDGERFDDCIEVAPGARFTFDSGFAMDVTGSYCLTAFDPEYNDLGHRNFQNGDNEQTDEERARYAPFPGGYAPQYGLGLNLMYTVDLNAHPSILSGTVTDAATGEVIDAAISFPGSEVEGVDTDAASGMYSVQIDKGDYTILAEADGYIPVSEAIEVPSGENITRNFVLQSMTGTVVGTVTDAGTGLPLEGLVATSGAQDNCDINGEYAIESPAGSRTFTASANGYANQSITVEVAAGETVTQDFELGIVLSFENVYFDYNMYNIRPDAAVVLDQVADVLISNPGVAVQISGNTDSDGSPEYNEGLAENRATAVRNYLIAKGVSEESLSTVGYGEDRPAAPNTTDENKALNRRSEFIILGAPIR